VRSSHLLFFLLAATTASAQPAAPVDPALTEISATIWYQQAVVSPDGSRLAYVQSASPGKSEIFTVSLAGGDSKPARIWAGESTSAESSVAWSPDSKQIAFVSYLQVLP